MLTKNEGHGDEPTLSSLKMGALLHLPNQFFVLASAYNALPTPLFIGCLKGLNFFTDLISLSKFDCWPHGHIMCSSTLFRPMRAELL